MTRDLSPVTTPLYVFEAVPAEGFDGWWDVMCGFGFGADRWETVAKVFGEKRAEIVRDALSEEANERV